MMKIGSILDTIQIDLDSFDKAHKMTGVQHFYLRGVRHQELLAAFLSGDLGQFVNVPLPQVESSQSGLAEDRVSFIRDRTGTVHLVGTSGEMAKECIHCGHPDVCLGVILKIVGTSKRLTVFMDKRNLCSNLACMLKHCRDYASQRPEWNESETLIYNLCSRLYPGQILSEAPARWDIDKFGGFQTRKSFSKFLFYSTPNMRLKYMGQESHT